MAELTLKDESVIDIGQAVGERVQSIASAGTGNAVIPAGGAAVAPVQPMNPIDSMMAVLEDIRAGIELLVDKFAEGNSLEKEQMQQQEMAEDLSQVGGDDVAPAFDDAGGDDRSFLQKGKDKVKELLGAGGFKGLLVKGGLIFGLLGIATMLKKYGKEIAKVITPVIDGIKTFFSAFSDDIGPLFDKAVAMVKDAIGGLLDIFKGLFTGDASTFFSGVKKLFVDFPIKLVSYIGDAFFSLLENALAAFGIESEMVTNIKNFFRELPENITKMFTDIGKFFTETIPQKVTEIKDSITSFFTDYIVTPAKQLFTDIGNFFTETIPEKFTEITGKVTSFFTDIVSSITGFFTDGFNFVTETIPNKLAEITSSIAQKFVDIKNDIIDFALAPFRKVKELFDNLLIGILESVEGIPFLGGKAKEMKENILASRTEENANTKTDFASQIEAGHQRFFEDVDKNKDEIKKFVEGSGYRFSLENSKSMYNTNQDSFIFKKPNGESFIHMNTDNFNAQETLDLIKSQPQITAFAPATAGMSGSDMNAQSAEFVGSGSPTGVDVKTVGGTNISTNSSVVHNSMSEETGTGDKSYKDNLYDF